MAAQAPKKCTWPCLQETPLEPPRCHPVGPASLAPGTKDVTPAKRTWPPAPGRSSCPHDPVDGAGVDHPGFSTRPRDRGTGRSGTSKTGLSCPAGLPETEPPRLPTQLLRGNLGSPVAPGIHSRQKLPAQTFQTTQTAEGLFFWGGGRGERKEKLYT